MDAGNLQNLLSAMNHGGGSSATPHSAQSQNNLYGGGSQPNPAGVVAQQLQNHPALAGYLQQQAQAQAQAQVPAGGGGGGGSAGGGVNMQEILARLGNYRQ